MKGIELSNPVANNKDELCQQIEKLQSEVNQLALRLSGCSGSEFHFIWSNLANARAYLATALDASHQLKDKSLPPLASDR
ncbi:MAG: hypothetical protein JWP00_4350 [Chloroflexi bacterium]|jgi:uncharacterized protein YukE|nr:hypothetical protein [Chloroflexota bacterium]